MLSELHVEVPQATANEGLVQSPYVVARMGFEPTTLRTKGNESTNEPPPPITAVIRIYYEIMIQYCHLYVKLFRDSIWLS